MRKFIISLAVVVISILALPNTAKAGGCTMSISATELRAKNATVINFEQTNIETSAGYWGDYGVKFTADNGKAIYVNGYNRGGASTASGEYALFNDAIFPATSVNQPLKVTFKNGVNQAGFYLGNGGAPTVSVNVSIKLYGKDGQQFCEVNAENVGKNVLTYASFNTLLDVYSMTVDYGNTTVGEEIDDLMFVNSNQNIRYCQESDNGDNKYVLGKSTLYNQDGSIFLSTADSCKDNSNVFEMVCNGSTWNMNTEFCGSGYSCVNGFCQAITIPNIQTCRETDGGEDVYVKGETTGHWSCPEEGRPIVKETDVCVDANTVREYLCNRGCDNILSQETRCPYGCENGACKKAVETAYCTDSDSGNIASTKGTVKLYSSGKVSYSTDICNDNNTVREYFCTTGNPALGTGPGYDSQLINCPHGCNDGVCMIATQTTAICTDSDNFDMYVRGTATGEKEGSRVFGNYVDSCSNQVGEKGLESGKWLVEEHCSGPSDKPYVHTQWNGCVNGCVNGACVKKTDTNPVVVNARCNDSDSGYSIYQKGVLTINPANASSYVVNEYCADANRNNVDKGDYLEELVCLDSNSNYAYEHKPVKCPYGCENGACKTQSGSTTDTTVGQCYSVSGNGFLAKAYNNPEVYYVDESIKHAFVTSQIYHSWFTDYSGVKSFPASEVSYINNLTVGANICLNSSGNTIDDNDNLDTSDDEVNDCQDQTVYDGHFELCAGEALTHQTSNIKLTNIRNNKNYIYLKLENSTKSTLVVYLGKSKDIYSRDWKKKVRITYEANSGDAVGKIKLQTMTGYGSMFCGDANYNEGNFITCLGSTITNYPTQIKLKVKDFTEDYVLLTVTGANVSSVKISKGQNILLTAKENTYLQVGYGGWASGQQVNLSVKVIGMSCGDSRDNDGLYSACMNDTVAHVESGIRARINNFTDKFVVFVFSGSSNYASNTGVRLDKGKELIVQNSNGTKLRYTYQSMSYTHGVNIKIETVQ